MELDFEHVAAINRQIVDELMQEDPIEPLPIAPMPQSWNLANFRETQKEQNSG